MKETAISSGVTSSGISASSHDPVTVLSGGTAISTTVMRNGVLTVQSGGSAISTRVKAGGTEIVSAGGSATEDTLDNKAFQIAEGTVIGTVAGSAAVQDLYGIESGGTFTEAVQVVESGGSALDVIMSGSTQNVFFGGYANSTVLLDSQETLFAGASATFTTVSGQAELFVASGATETSALIVDGGSELDSGTSLGAVIASGGVLSVGGPSAVASGSTVFGGTLEVLSGGTALSALVGSLSRDGIMIVSSGGSAIDTEVGARGSEVISAGGSATGDFIGTSGIEIVSSGGIASDTIISGGTLTVGSAGTASGDVTFSGSGGVLEISGGIVSATIVGFSSGDTIDLATLSFSAGGTATLNSATDVLTVTEGGSAARLQLAGDYASASFGLAADAGSGTLLTVSGTIIETSGIPCFAAGTRILTERGLVAVEQLAIGDRVMTAERGTMPITWIGHRRIDCRRHPEPQKIQPVLIAAHAFGRGAPGRDLLLSPDHAVFAEGVLIPVKHLINGSMIRQVVIPAVTYFHVALDRHAVILAEGLPVESYLDTGDRGGFENAEGSTALHPAFASERGDIMLIVEAIGYAPLRVTGPEVEAVRARLATGAKRYPPRGHTAAAARG
jgi:autotransporter passenger strand-loop-strand repeat protein